ncbi:MAG: DUF4491 family protein [Chloroflexi bacterium]|nr:DUF4491 family protein [Chloroflexota bacterium]
MNYFGLLTGLATLLIIGLGFPLVIQGERKFGFLWWPYMMTVGIALIVASLLIQSDWLAVVIGVLGATFVWGSTELKEQAVRAEIGWYPFNPNKLKPPFEKTIKNWRAPHL